jgi:6-pyruvoyltetrahydropterin/6-carboxytetrahydropterin synthase
MYRSSKTYGHERGLSCTFRQHKAHSHCRFLHGYALAVHLEFEAQELDACGWVVDFGALKSFWGTLQDQFDHKLLVAADDPALPFLLMMDQPEPAISADPRPQLAQVCVVPATGCEAFAEMIYFALEVWLLDNGFTPRVQAYSIRVSEHGANSATYTGEVTW